MTTSLAGIVLSDDLRLDGLENAAGIAYTTKRTVTGSLVVHTASNTKGRTLTLTGTYDYTKSQIDQIKEVEQQGARVSLVHPRGEFTVIITSVSVEPATQNPDPSDDEWYSGDITMIEV